MLRLFLDNRIGVLILLPFFLLLYLLGDIIGAAPYFGAQDQPAFVSIPNWTYWGVVCLQFIILIINALCLNWVFNSQEFLEKNTYIISLNYLIFSSFFIDFGHFSWMPIIHTCCILMLAVFFGVRPQIDARKAGFNAGFLFGIALLFNSQLLFLIPALLIMLVVLRTLQIRELILLLLGLASPILLLYASYYVAEQPFNFPFKFNGQLSQLHWFEITILVLLHILLVLSLIGLRARLLKASLRLKKQIQVLNVFTFFTWFLGLSAFILVSQTSLLSLLVLPLSFYFAYALLSSSLGISSHLFFYLFLLSTLLKFVVLSF
ncbi:MAG: hypothetical protein ACKOBN_01595 [Flavobacteriales bacterium]